MNEKKKAEWKGMFKGIGIVVLVLAVIGIVNATVLITDSGIWINNNKVLVEEDFTSWAHQWTNDLPNGSWDTSFTGFLIDETNNKLSIAWYDGNASGDHWNRWGVFNLADFSEVFVSPAEQDYTYGYPEIDFKSSSQFGNVDFSRGISRSLQSYTCLLNSSGFLEVWRGGSSPLWSHNVSTDAGLYYSYGHGGISATGKYIIFIAYKDTGNDAWVLLYEGT